MKDSALTLYLEIDFHNFKLFAVEHDDENNFKIVSELLFNLKGIENNRITNLEQSYNAIKENIYLIEQRLNHTFKNIVLIIDNFNPTFNNLTGFKKLDGSQVLRENITYILNTLKSIVNENEKNKTLLHIFNSKFFLDKKKIENLPIGLFGDFYSHELSFVLINTNDYKNLDNIFVKCNLKIKKILIKSFIKGAYISNTNKNFETFFHIQINENHSKIFYFENNSLKFEQNFNFGTDIIIKDISKITLLNFKTVKKILNEIKLQENILDDELIEERYFENDEFKKVKKKLFYEIALARIKEISELIFLKNINLNNKNILTKNIFLEMNNSFQPKSLKVIFDIILSKNNDFYVNFIDSVPNKSLLIAANEIVHFGWEKEAIPVTHSKKSIIAKFFDIIFG